MTCPDENSIAGYLQRWLSEAGSERLEEYLDGCPGCRAVVDVLVDLFSSNRRVVDHFVEHL